MEFGERTLRIKTKGRDVAELQLRLAGFAGTVWDGDFGKKTKNQVLLFQKDFMKMEEPTGIVEAGTYEALDRFAKEFPIKFNKKLHCACKPIQDRECQGYGQRRFKKTYRKARSMDLFWSRTGGRDWAERTHQYEYPGIHKAVLHTYRAFLFYTLDSKFKAPRITSGYRCHMDNVDHKRKSTNHMGKAIDFTFDPGDQNIKTLCNEARDLLVAKSNCQIRWGKKNQKALEPGIPKKGKEYTADVWVHLDVRQYEPGKYLLDRFFVSNEEALDDKELGG